MAQEVIVMTAPKWVEQIKSALKGKENFDCGYTTDNGTQHEIHISVIWDQEAHEVATDFSVLAKTWPNLNDREILRDRKKSVMGQISRIRNKRVYGLSEIDGYEVCASFKNANGKNTITIIFTREGIIEFERSKLLCMPKQQTGYEVTLTQAPDLIQKVLTYIYAQFIEIADKESNKHPATTIETYLEALLLMIETRLRFLEGITNIPADTAN